MPEEELFKTEEEVPRTEIAETLRDSRLSLLGQELACQALKRMVFALAGLMEAVSTIFYLRAIELSRTNGDQLLHTTSDRPV